MALVNFRKRKQGKLKLYCNENAVENLIYYIMSDEKTPSRIYGGIGVSTSDKVMAVRQFHAVKQAYRNTKGKQALHFWVSFDEEKMYSLGELRHIGYEIAKFFGGEYQIIFALHENTDNYHIHFVVNTVNFITGKKIRWNRGELYRLIKYVEKY